MVRPGMAAGVGNDTLPPTGVCACTGALPAGDRPVGAPNASATFSGAPISVFCPRGAAADVADVAAGADVAANASKNSATV